MSGPGLVMVGAFPPPLGGASKNNQILYESLASAGVNVVRLDTAASASSLHNHSLRFHAARIRRNLLALLGARRAAGRDGIFYHVPDGGAGVLYSLAHVYLAARRFGRIVLHHRTFRYIDEHSPAMQAMVRAAPERTTHVFLSAGMAERFQQRYGRLPSTLVASNARFVHAEAQAAPIARDAGPIRIGHLSNLCAEKGFFDVAMAFETVRAANVEAHLHLAGPVLEPEVERRLTELRERWGPAICYHGPLTGAAKRDFYRNLDLFLFPTRFAQEASPNVVFEALAAGVPVVATARACLPEMVPEGSGAIVPCDEDFPARAAAYLGTLALEEPARTMRQRAIKQSLLTECVRSMTQYAELMTLLGATSQVAIGQEF